MKRTGNDFPETHPDAQIIAAAYSRLHSDFIIIIIIIIYYIFIALYIILYSASQSWKSK